MRRRRGVCRDLVGEPERKNHLENPGVDGRIILRWIFRKWDVGLWTGASWLNASQIYTVIQFFSTPTCFGSNVPSSGNS
jgi:hypothetical protein